MPDQLEMPTIKDFRPFLICSPACFDSCCAFYRRLGFETLWRSDVICEMHTGFGQQRLLLSLHHGATPGRGMFHYWVDDVDAWYAYLVGLKLEDDFPTVKIAAPTVAEWGWRITYLWDPAGRLLHFAEPHSDKNKAFFNNASWMP